MRKRLNEKVEEDFDKGLRNYLDYWYNDRHYAPLGVDLRVKDELCLRVSLSCKHEDESKKNVPFSIHLEFAFEGAKGFEHFYDEEDEIKYFENYEIKKPKDEIDFFKKVYDVIDRFMEDYKEEALDSLKENVEKSYEHKKEMDKYIENVEKKTKSVISDLEKEGFKVEKHTYEFYDKVGTLYLYLKDNVTGEKTFEKISKILSKYGTLDKEYTDMKNSLVVLNFPALGKLKENKKQFKKFKPSAINEGKESFEVKKYSKVLKQKIEVIRNVFKEFNVELLEKVKAYREDDFRTYEYYGEFYFKEDIEWETLDEIMDSLPYSRRNLYPREGTDGYIGIYINLGFGNQKDLYESKKQFKKFKPSAINEAELTELKDAIINREEFVDENVVGTSIGEDYIVSVFDKAVLIFTSDNTPFIIGREDLTEEEMDIVEELYSVLEINVDINDEGEEEELFVDDNTSDDLEMTEKSLKESSYPKAYKELKSVVKELKDEFKISSSKVDKNVHGNDLAEEQGYDYLYVGVVSYKNEAPKDMLEEYKEWYEDSYGGRFDYDLNNKIIEFELGYGDDKDMVVSMEKFMFESAGNKN